MYHHGYRLSLLMLLLLDVFWTSVNAAKYTAIAELADQEHRGLGIQRTMTLLATSTKEQPHTVLILLYGHPLQQKLKIAYFDNNNR